MNSECNRARPVYRRIHRGERQCRKGLRVHRTKVELMRYPPLRHEKQPPSQGRRLTMNGKKKQQTRHSGGATSCARSGATPAILRPGRPGRKGGRGSSSCQESVKQDGDGCAIHVPFLFGEVHPGWLCSLGTRQIEVGPGLLASQLGRQQLGKATDVGI